LRWLGAPDVSLTNLPLLSANVLLSSFLVTALSAALFEEAGYRGYFQHLLAERYGSKTAILLSAFIFMLAHISRGRAFFVVLPLVFLFGCLYGMVAWKTGSILPGVIVHFIYNFARLLERLLSPQVYLGTQVLGALGLALASGTWIIFRRLPEGNPGALDAASTLEPTDGDGSPPRQAVSP
jgi:membrane protease YdiL (CAAX protease family)